MGRTSRHLKLKYLSTKFIVIYLSSLCLLLRYFRKVLFILGWFSRRLMKTLIPTSTSCCSTDVQDSLMLVTSFGFKWRTGISLPPAPLILSPMGKVETVKSHLYFLLIFQIRIIVQFFVFYDTYTFRDTNATFSSGWWLCTIGTATST